ncbi:MAG TPA: hypothetical protein VGO16_04770 [Pseudonocardiaceae bacterium]|jgi:hypothetical protein|nr:hypothetical protein [Pseudonocardiaceae bacterium]
MLQMSQGIVKDVGPPCGGGTIQALAAHSGHFEMASLKKAVGGMAELAAARNLEQETPLLRAAAELADNNVEMSKARSWRLHEL